MSVADLLDDHFEHDGLKGSIASTGVVGVWAGPRTPGTAYNLLHHALGEIDGISGGWGQVIGGMGAISQALARSAEASGAEIRTGAAVESVDVRDGRVVGVTLADGEEIRAPIVASGAHPKTTVLDLTGAEHFPEDVADDMRRYRTRGGSVKVNLVLSEAPKYEGVTGEQQHMLERTGRQPLPLDRLSRAGLAGRPRGQARRPALRRGRASLVRGLEPHRRRALGDDHVHAIRPPGRGRLARRRAGALRGRLRRPPGPLRPQRPRRDPRARGSGAPRPGAHLRPGRRLDLPGRAGTRPDGLHAATPMLAQYATPVDGLYLCGAGPIRGAA